MYSLAAEVGETPFGVVTTTSTTRAVFAGAVAVICESLSTTKTAVVPPKVTEVAPVKNVPEIMTELPPVVKPDVGFNKVTDGGGMM